MLGFPPSSLSAITRLIGLTTILGLSACKSTNHATKDQAEGQGAEAPASAASNLQGPTTPPNPGMIYKLASVERADAELISKDRAKVTVNGLLNDGATRIYEIRQEPTERGVSIVIMTERPRDAIASLGLLPFQQEVTVDLSGRPAGPCEITVHGINIAFNVP